MKTLKSIISKFKVLASDVEKEALNLTKESDDFFEDGNTDQLLRGKQPNESTIIPEYKSALYAEFKERTAPNQDRAKFTPNLKDTGDFHRSIKYSPGGKAFNISAVDKYGLQTKYGELLGVSERTKKGFKNDVLKPELRGFVRKVLL